MPRHTVDAVGIRPIDLVIIDGIETVSGGEGPWVKELAVQRPGLLLAGRNPVCTDSVATAVMGYDPMGAPATGPVPGRQPPGHGRRAGPGDEQPEEIEVVGLSIKEARHPFGWEPKSATLDPLAQKLWIGESGSAFCVGGGSVPRSSFSFEQPRRTGQQIGGGGNPGFGVGPLLQSRSLRLAEPWFFAEVLAVAEQQEHLRGEK